MDNMNLVKKLPPMLSGNELEQALTILPEYDPSIINENAAVRLIALSDMYKVFVPTQMSKEIYAKMYLSLLRSLQKKESKLAVRQYSENHKGIRQQEYSGIIGGSDSFTIIGASGIGKSSSITRALQLLTTEEIIEIKNPYSKIIPCVIVQTPFDSSVKGLLLEILRVVDEKLGSKYYSNALRTKSTIHKYMIKEAIADGNVLRFSVEYMRSVSVKGVSDPSIDVSALDDEEYCRRNKINLDDLYHNEDRIAAIADDILTHLDQHTRLENGNVYTSIFAIASRTSPS